MRSSSHAAATAVLLLAAILLALAARSRSVASLANDAPSTSHAPGGSGDFVSARERATVAGGQTANGAAPAGSRHFDHFQIMGYNDPYWYWEEYCIAQPAIWRHREKLMARLASHDLSTEARRHAEVSLTYADSYATIPGASICRWLYDDAPNPADSPPADIAP